jgi:hypothetical protein
VATAGDKQAFTAYGNSANMLSVPAGVADPAPDCINPAQAPPVQAWNSAGVPTSFSSANARTIP